LELKEGTLDVAEAPEPTVALAPVEGSPPTTEVTVDCVTGDPPACVVFTSVEVASPGFDTVLVRLRDAVVVVNDFGPPGVPPGGAKEMSELTQTILPTSTVFVDKYLGPELLKDGPS
jgi:hypothetical protein